MKDVNGGVERQFLQQSSSLPMSVDIRLKNNLLKLLYNTFELVTCYVCMERNDQSIYEKVIKSYLERERMKQIEKCFTIKYQYSDGNLLLFDMLFHFPFMEVFWSRLEENLIKMFGSGIYKIEIEPAVQYMKFTINFYHRNVRKPVNINNVILHYNVKHKRTENFNIDFEFVARVARKIFQNIL